MPLCPSRRGGSNLQVAGQPIVNASNAAALNTYLTTYPAFTQTIAANFPNAVPLASLVLDLTADLANEGFVPGDAIPMISVCRDEITRPLVDAVESLWGNSFSLGSLAGMMFCGTTGLSAGMHHSPVVNNTDRFIFITASHVGISAQGVVGKVMRVNVPTISSACGALSGFISAMTSGNISFELSTTDLEQTMLMAQLQSTFTYGQVPSLATLTTNAGQLILTQLQAAISAFNLDEANYAVLSGVQIHGPDYQTFFQPLAYYTVDETGTQTKQNIANLGAGGGFNAAALAKMQQACEASPINF